MIGGLRPPYDRQHGLCQAIAMMTCGLEEFRANHHAAGTCIEAGLLEQCSPVVRSMFCVTPGRNTSRKHASGKSIASGFQTATLKERIIMMDWMEPDGTRSKELYCRHFQFGPCDVE
jgi:hypothetical protein